MSEGRERTSLVPLVLWSATLLRTLVGFQPHSGQDNYHGKSDGYGGDYEAQRHWMELTWHLPIADWYRYDLQYWGLDYPPLTAYVSYLCGAASEWLVGPESMELFGSRGYEDPIHKAFMRGTVLVLDVMIYYSAVYVLSKRLGNNESERLWILILALMQPAIILIDHGHFQYNTVSMGLALWSFHFMTKGFDDKARVKTDNDIGHFFNCVAGSVFFCLALNFKQMTLYYAPAVFAYLLGRCFVRQNSIVTGVKRSAANGQVEKRFAALGVTVILTFLALWWPFVVYTPSEDGNASVSHRLLHIVGRIFPFQRGLFEGKVSNLWCTLSIRPVSIRRRLPEDIQPLIALAVTVLLILPACIKLFLVGRNGTSQRKNCNAHLKTLLWGSMSTSLSFFLASFQVHEKSILIALAPASLLFDDASEFVSLFSVVSVWTLWPLIQTDRLQVAYVACIVIFILLLILHQTSIPKKTVKGNSLESYSWGKALAFIISTIMFGLHVLEMCISPPATLPDLFPVLWSIVGCGCFCISWCMTCWYLFYTDTIQLEPMKHTKKAQ